MWNTFKTKLKNLFTYEVVEETFKPKEEIKKIEISNEELLKRKKIKGPIAKMTYQYPKERNFRFPLVDQNEEVKQKSTHSKQTPNIKRSSEPVRKQVQKSNVKQDLIFKNASYDHNHPKYKSSEQIQTDNYKSENNNAYQFNNRKIEKEPLKEGPRKVFKPTEVPSPIYGFQKRDSQRKIEETPAYIRRDEKEILKQKDSVEVVNHNEQSIQSDLFSSDIMTDEDRTLNKKQNPIQSSLHQNQTMIKDEVNNRQVKNEHIELTDKQPLTPRRIKRDSSLSNEIPYNVMRSRMETLKMYKQEASSTVEEVNVKPLVNENQFVEQVNDEKIVENEFVYPEQTDRILENESETYPAVEEKEITSIENEQTNLQALKNVQHETIVQELETEETQDIAMPFHLLDDSLDTNQTDVDWILSQQNLLEETLKHFNVEAKVVNVIQGPSVTRFEVQPALGVKVSKVKNLSDDLKLNMSAQDIRIEAPIPGKNTIGIEIPNLDPQTVGLQEILESTEFEESTSKLSIGLGLSIEGKPIVTNISKMPHGLIAGATGSGKSVCINTILISLLYKSSHKDVRLLLIDPKMVELAAYNGIPHLVSPVITDVKAATQALKWAVQEMEDRYGKFVTERVRDISKYNEKMSKENRPEEKMPFLVIVIDELADLMMVSPQDVEDAICRIAQKARACGIHLLLATQRPSVDVITGLIKANIPTRIAFSVSSQIDSRTILDASGAEKLLGKGDMLFVENGTSKSVRIQGAFVSDDEIERVANHARSIAPANYLFEQEELLARITTNEEEDELLPQVIEFIMDANQASTSLLQRHFRIGYNRAARLIDTLESRGIINQQNGSRPREVLVTRSQLDEIL